MFDKNERAAPAGKCWVAGEIFGLEILFADVESESGTGLIITECITYGRNGARG